MIKNNNSMMCKKIIKLDLNDKEFYIEGICINKSILRNNENTGFRFFVDFKDDTGTIRILAFNKEDEKFYEKFIVNEMFKVFNANVKVINTKFNQIGCKFELRLKKYSYIEYIKNINKFRKESIKLIHINEILNKRKSEKVNILAIFVKVGDIRSVKSPFKLF